MAIDTHGVAAATGTSVERPLPIGDYETLTVGQVLPRLAGLTVCELHQVADYERRHAHRHAVLEAIERALG